MTTPTPATKHKVDQFIDINKAGEDANISSVNLRGEVERQSGLVSYYTAKAASAVRQTARFKLQLEIKEAQTASEVRATALESGIKATVDYVKEQVRLSKEVIALEVALIDAQEVEDVLKGKVAALKDKSSNLITLTSMDRDEIRAKIKAEQDYQLNNSPVSERSKALQDRMAS